MGSVSAGPYLISWLGQLALAAAPRAHFWAGDSVQTLDDDATYTKAPRAGFHFLVQVVDLAKGGGFGVIAPRHDCPAIPMLVFSGVKLDCAQTVGAVGNLWVGDEDAFASMGNALFVVAPIQARQVNPCVCGV